MKERRRGIIVVLWCEGEEEREMMVVLWCEGEEERDGCCVVWVFFVAVLRRER